MPYLVQDKVQEYNSLLVELEVPELHFVDHKSLNSIGLYYSRGSEEICVGYLTSTDSSEQLSWLKFQKSQFSLYKQVFNYFQSNFKHAELSGIGNKIDTDWGFLYSFSLEEGVVSLQVEFTVEGNYTSLSPAMGDVSVVPFKDSSSSLGYSTKLVVTSLCFEGEVQSQLKHMTETLSTFKSTFIQNANIRK